MDSQKPGFVEKKTVKDPSTKSSDSMNNFQGP